MIDSSLRAALRHRDSENLKAKRHCDLRITRKNAHGVWVLKEWSACNGRLQRKGWNAWYCEACKCVMSIGRRRVHA